MTATADTPSLPVIRAADIDPGAAGLNHWLVQNLWALSGVGMLCGAPKCGKTWLGLDLALSVASGTACLGRFPVLHQGPALLFLAEDALPMLKARLLALCQHRGLDLAQLDLFVITAPSLRLDSPGDIRLLTQAVASFRPRVLLLDPFIRMHHADENNAQEVAAILDRLRLLQRSFDLAIVLVHHARKNARPGPNGLALRGSGDLWAWGDSNLYLARHKGFLQLSIEHRAAPSPQPFHLTLELDPPHLAVIEPHGDLPLSLDQRILLTLDEAAAPLGRSDLRQRLGVNNARLGQALLDLEHQQLVKKTSQGWMRTTVS